MIVYKHDYKDRIVLELEESEFTLLAYFNKIIDTDGGSESTSPGYKLNRLLVAGVFSPNENIALDGLCKIR